MPARAAAAPAAAPARAPPSRGGRRAAACAPRPSPPHCARPARAAAVTTSSGTSRRSPSPPADRSRPRRFDLVGLGQAMVDFSATVDDAFLDAVGAVKGGRR